MDNNNQVTCNYYAFEYVNSSYYNFIYYEVLGLRNTEEDAQAIFNSLSMADINDRHIFREYFTLDIEDGQRVVVFNHDHDWIYQGHELYNHEDQVEEDYIKVEDAPEEIQEEVQKV